MTTTVWWIPWVIASAAFLIGMTYGYLIFGRHDGS